MYRIYETEAIILSAAPSAECGRAYTLLTPELGIVVARAEGVRKSASKFRYALQTLSTLSLSLVRGKGFYRIVHAEPRLSYRSLLASASGALSLAARIAWLLRRMVGEGEANPKLFAVIKEFLILLSTTPRESLSLLEIATVMRVLSLLGYFPERSEYADMFEGPLAPALPRVGALREHLIKDINEALSASHL